MWKSPYEHFKWSFASNWIAIWFCFRCWIGLSFACWVFLFFFCHIPQLLCVYSIHGLYNFHIDNGMCNEMLTFIKCIHIYETSEKCKYLCMRRTLTHEIYKFSLFLFSFFFVGSSFSIPVTVITVMVPYQIGMFLVEILKIPTDKVVSISHIQHIIHLLYICSKYLCLLYRNSRNCITFYGIHWHLNSTIYIITSEHSVIFVSK